MHFFLVFCIATLIVCFFTLVKLLDDRINELQRFTYLCEKLVRIQAKLYIKLVKRFKSQNSKPEVSD